MAAGSDGHCGVDVYMSILWKTLVVRNEVHEEGTGGSTVRLSNHNNWAKLIDRQVFTGQ